MLLKFYTYFFLFLIFYLKSFCGIYAQENQNNKPTFDKTDLLQKNGIKLDDNWEFYWNSFIQPNEFENQKPLDIVKLSSWTNYVDENKNNLPAFGYATYKINFSIPKERPNVSLYIPRIIASYKIWINGVFILETGRIGTSKENTLHRRFTKIIPLDSNKTDFTVVIQVANYYNKKAGITVPILLGETDTLFYKKSLQLITDMVSVGSFSFIGILFLIFYLLYWSKDKAVLYFSIMCIALSYHTLNDRYAPFTKVFEEINWVLLAKTEYIASYIVGYCASLFFALILKHFVHKWYTKTVTYSIITFIALAILLPAPYFTELIIPFLIFMLINITYICFIIIKSIIAKSNVSKLLLVNIIFATLTFLAHILFFIEENEIALIYVKLGYIFVFLFISMLLLQRFSRSFHKLEQANYLALLQKREISEQSKELAQVNSKLKENLKLLEDNNAELEDFNHIISHDLKTPLVSVYSLASFIEEDLKHKLDTDTAYHIKMMKEVISKMEASINGLLEYSKVAKGSKHKELFYFNSVLERVNELINHQNKSVINLPKEAIEIYANKIELEHVFQNLIGNSIKYNHKEKAIIDINLSVKDDEYVFSVSDNGPGINPKYHQKIFKIFSQLETNDKDINSTGVGLAIVKKIISNNNGVISVASEKGEGLTISFTWKKNIKS